MERIEGTVTVDHVEEHKFKPELFQAQVRMAITSKYPKRAAESGGLFSTSEYNLPTQDFRSERVAWIDVPHGMSKEDVEKRLAACPKARINRVLMSEPVITDNLAFAIRKGWRTKEQIAEKQMVKDKDGKVVTYAGKPVYKVNTFNALGGQDVDKRHAIKEEEELVTEAAVETAVTGEKGQ